MTAEWKNLIMANFVIDPKVLEKYLPSGTEIDYFNGKTFVSVVGFLFANTKVRGLRIPFHINFQEVNLRFYVRYKEQDIWKRGTVFISEIVPRAAITFVANNIYHENYRTLPMKHFLKESDVIKTGYHWKFKGRWNKIEVTAGSTANAMIVDSEESFIAEHYWGYARFSKTVTYEYQVAHIPWMVYPVSDYLLECDFEGLYGPEFSLLKSQQPSSVFLAKGSPVEVYKKRKL